MEDPYVLSVKEKDEWQTEEISEYQRYFKGFDKDKSGYIERNELPELLKSIVKY